MDTKNTGKRIKERMLELGLTPTEMERRTGYSRVTISRYCNGETKIPISRLPNIANALTCSQEYLLGVRVEQATPESNDAIRYNVIGSVKCGYGAEPIENYDGDIVHVLRTQLRNYSPEECFVLRARGESMMPFIQDGDLLLIHKQNECGSGDVALVATNDGAEATLKKVHKGEGFIELVPFNDEYPAVVYRGKSLASVRICGKCFHISREL